MNEFLYILGEFLDIEEKIFGAKFIGKVYLKYKFCLIQQDLVFDISVC